MVMPPRQRRGKQSLSVSILEVLFLAVFWLWVFSAILFLRNTVLPRLPLAITPAALNLPFESVTFKATDGVLLGGWKLPPDAEGPWVVLCHGVGSNRADLLETAAALRKAEFGVFLFDFRGHGDSQGRTTSFGWTEQRDLEGALAYLGQQPEVPARPYGLYGISMGGAVGLMVAARDERIGAVAADSPYTTLEETLGRHLTLMYPLPKLPFLWFINATYRLRFGAWPGRISPLESAAALRPRPLLLIQGGQDPRMPPEGARRIFKHAGQPKELWIIEGAGHLEGYSLDPAAYHARLIAFFRSSLR